MADRQTLDVYAERARDYAARFESDAPGKSLSHFISEMPEGARVLDLGCGTGRSAAFMRDAGLEVDAWDASPEMAALAKELHGLDVTIHPFDALDVEAVYDGVFANFSLLHAPKSEMPGHLARVHLALKSEGLFHLGLKLGDGERRDALGRFYAYYGEEELAELLHAAGFAIETKSTGKETGLDGTVAPWIILTARSSK